MTTDLAALGRLKISHRLIMGKWCLHASSFIFDRIIIKVAGNQDRHKSSVEFDFGIFFFFLQSECLSNLTILYGLCILDSSFLY